MGEENQSTTNYLKNTKTSKDRTIRIEMVGEVSDAERHFLDGLSYFAAGTISKEDDKYTTYISGLMIKLIKHIVTKLRKDKEEDNKDGTL